MFCPAKTGSGESDFVSDRSAMSPVTVVVVVCELFDAVGSDVSLETLAVFEMTVPSAVPAPTLTTIVKVSGPLVGRNEGFVKVTVPVPPGEGAIVDHPDGAKAETNVVFGGVVSVTTAFTAVSGPKFWTSMV